MNQDKKTIDLGKGKLQPQAIDLEMAVLGAMLIDKVGQDEAFSVLNTPEVFYKDSHKAIFEAMTIMYANGDPIDLLTASAQLKKLTKLEVAGGDFYLIRLTQSISSSAHVEYHARILLQHYMKRMIIFFSSQNIALAYDDTTDVFDLLRGWQKSFDNLSDSIATGRSTMSFPADLHNLKKDIETLSKNKEEVQLVGIDTGF
jgi:replicative DNA helicase